MLRVILAVQFKHSTTRMQLRQESSADGRSGASRAQELNSISIAFCSTIEYPALGVTDD